MNDQSLENTIVVALAAFGLMKLLEGVLFPARPTVVILDAGDSADFLRDLVQDAGDGE